MTGLDKKQYRTIDYHLRMQFGGKSFEPFTFEAVRKLGPQSRKRRMWTATVTDSSPN